jgi:hypothetical protein
MSYIFDLANHLIISLLLSLLHPLFLVLWGLCANVYYYLCGNNFKVSRMFVSATHATSVILAYYMNIPGYYLYYFSVSYYLVDTFFELTNILLPENGHKNIKLFDCGIVLHHFVTMSGLVYLWYPETQNHMYYAFCMSEISNLPMYVVYYMKHKKIDEEITRKAIICEAIAYVFIRLILGSKMVCELWYNDNIPSLMTFSAIIILVLSYVWTAKVISQALK